MTSNNNEYAMIFFDLLYRVFPIPWVSNMFNSLFEIAKHNDGVDEGLTGFEGKIHYPLLHVVAFRLRQNIGLIQCGLGICQLLLVLKMSSCSAGVTSVNQIKK
jgi:hypothetical protein